MVVAGEKRIEKEKVGVQTNGVDLWKNIREQMGWNKDPIMKSEVVRQNGKLRKEEVPIDTLKSFVVPEFIAHGDNGTKVMVRIGKNGYERVTQEKGEDQYIMESDGKDLYFRKAGPYDYEPRYEISGNDNLTMVPVSQEKARKVHKERYGEEMPVMPEVDVLV